MEMIFLYMIAFSLMGIAAVILGGLWCLTWVLQGVIYFWKCRKKGTACTDGYVQDWREKKASAIAASRARGTGLQ